MTDTMTMSALRDDAETRNVYLLVALTAAGAVRRAVRLSRSNAHSTRVDWEQRGWKVSVGRAPLHDATWREAV